MRVRRFALAACLGAALLATAACGRGSGHAGPDGRGQQAAPQQQPAPQQGAQQPARAPVKISFWHAMNTEQGAQGKTLLELIDRFHKENPDVVVDQVYQGSYSQLNQKLQAALAAGAAPTIAQLTDDVMARLWNARALVDLNRFVRDPRLGLSAEDLKDIPAFFLEANTIGGGLAAWPFAKSTQVLIYDKKLVPNPPRTWEEFRQVAKQATRDGLYGTAFPATVDYLDLFMGGAGARWLSDDLSRPAFNSPEAVAALELIVAMVRDGSALQMPPNTYQSNFFNEGRVAMVATTSASLSFIHEGSDGKRDWAVAPLFAGPKGNKSPFFGNSIGILASAKPEEQEAAWRFIKFLTSPESTALWAVRTGYVPIRFSAQKTAIWQEAVQKDPGIAVAASQLDRGTFQPVIPEWFEIRRHITSAVEAAVQGKMTPQEALDDAARKAEEILAKRKK